MLPVISFKKVNWFDLVALLPFLMLSRMNHDRKGWQRFKAQSGYFHNRRVCGSDGGYWFEVCGHISAVFSNNSRRIKLKAVFLRILLIRQYKPNLIFLTLRTNAEWMNNSFHQHFCTTRRKMVGSASEKVFSIQWAIDYLISYSMGTTNLGILLLYLRHMSSLNNPLPVCFGAWQFDGKFVWFHPNKLNHHHTNLSPEISLYRCTVP